MSEETSDESPRGGRTCRGTTSRAFHLCKESHDVPEQDQERCIGEITEDDMMFRLLCQEEHGYGGEVGKAVFSGKGNRSLLWSDEEEDGEHLGFGVSEEMGRPGGRRIWDQEDWRSRDGQEGRRIWEDRDWKDRDWKCQCARLELLRVCLRVFQLYVADWHKSNLSMRALATRFL